MSYCPIKSSWRFRHLSQYFTSECTLLA